MEIKEKSKTSSKILKIVPSAVIIIGSIFAIKPFITKPSKA